MVSNLTENRELVEYRVFTRIENGKTFAAVVAGLLVVAAVTALGGDFGIGVVAGVLSAPTVHGLLHLR